MKSVLGLLGWGFAALVVQGGIATFLSPPYCPNLALLVVLGIGLHCPGQTTAIALATVLGYATDLVSGALLGQNALIFLFLCGAARIAGRRLNLRGALALAAFAAGATFLSAGAQITMMSSLGASGTIGWSGFADIAKHAVANALLATPIATLTGRVLEWAGEDERSQLELGPRRQGL